MTFPTRLDDTEIFPSGQTLMAAAPLTLDQPVQPHDHTFWELVVVHGGSARHRSIDRVLFLGEPTMLVIPPDTWHAYDRCRSLALYNCYISTVLLEGPLAWVMEDPHLNHLFWSRSRSIQKGSVLSAPLTSEDLRQARTYLDALCQPALNHVQAIGWVLLLLEVLARAMQTSARHDPPDTSGLPHVAIRKAVRLLEQHLTDAWTLNELAKRVRLNPSYLVRLFHKELGMTPMAFLTRLRARRAAGQLLQTSRPVGMIGAAVGWEDPNYFARRFKTCFGVSPSQYRKRYGQET